MCVQLYLAQTKKPRAAAEWLNRQRWFVHFDCDRQEVHPISLEDHLSIFQAPIPIFNEVFHGWICEIIPKTDLGKRFTRRDRVLKCKCAT